MEARDAVTAQWLAEALADGADIDRRYEGFTLLMWASLDGNADMARTLLERGANVHLTVGEPGPEDDCDSGDGRDLMTGATALLLAAQYALEGGTREDGARVVCLLLEHGANPALRNSSQETALSFAASWGSADAVRSLLAHGVDVSGDLGAWPLRRAVAAQSYEAVDVLLGAGVDVNATDDGWTSLMTAASVGDVTLIETLLSAGADPALLSKNGETALDVAIRNKNDAAAERLLKDIKGDVLPDGGVTPPA
ncbi:MAG: hypothetical protein JWQ02_943 [Capsulimonas sp.]|nr:hypothetical protein [Capsulimonas sp.]